MRRWCGSDRQACARETARKSSALAVPAPGPPTDALSGCRRSARALRRAQRQQGRASACKDRVYVSEQGYCKIHSASSGRPQHVELEVRGRSTRTCAASLAKSKVDMCIAPALACLKCVHRSSTAQANGRIQGCMFDPIGVCDPSRMGRIPLKATGVQLSCTVHSARPVVRTGTRRARRRRTQSAAGPGTRSGRGRPLGGRRAARHTRARPRPPHRVAPGRSSPAWEMRLHARPQLAQHVILYEQFDVLRQPRRALPDPRSLMPCIILVKMPCLLAQRY